jgi:hypothetical protein
MMLRCACQGHSTPRRAPGQMRTAAFRTSPVNPLSSSDFRDATVTLAWQPTTSPRWLSWPPLLSGP